MTKPSYEELERSEKYLTACITGKGGFRELLDAANEELARVRGLLQRSTELLKQSLPTLRWAVDLEFDSTRLDDLSHLVEVGRLLGEIDRLSGDALPQQNGSSSSSIIGADNVPHGLDCLCDFCMEHA